MKYILGVDLGTQAGFSRVYDDGRLVGYSKKLESDFGRRLHGLAAEIERHNTPDCIGVVIEKPFGKFRGMDVMMAMFGVAMYTCERLGMPYSQAHLMTIKKAATGKGNAKKPDMIEAAKARFGENVDEHTADAAHCAAYGWDVGLFTPNKTA